MEQISSIGAFPVIWGSAERPESYPVPSARYASDISIILARTKAHLEILKKNGRAPKFSSRARDCPQRRAIDPPSIGTQIVREGREGNGMEWRGMGEGGGGKLFLLCGQPPSPTLALHLKPAPPEIAISGPGFSGERARSEYVTRNEEHVAHPTRSEAASDRTGPVMDGDCRSSPVDRREGGISRYENADQKTFELSDGSPLPPTKLPLPHAAMPSRSWGVLRIDGGDVRAKDSRNLPTRPAILRTGDDGAVATVANDGPRRPPRAWRGVARLRFSGRGRPADLLAVAPDHVGRRERPSRLARGARPGLGQRDAGPMGAPGRRDFGQSGDGSYRSRDRAEDGPVCDRWFTPRCCRQAKEKPSKNFWKGRVKVKNPFRSSGPPKKERRSPNPLCATHFFHETAGGSGHYHHQRVYFLKDISYPADRGGPTTPATLPPGRAPPARSLGLGARAGAGAGGWGRRGFV
ncbi:hypothetical protein AXG93_291s1090 [Marchantia polymorpha subsp. ruderalis]|uniref:Uncharacterized protein n=1 Tax=Marchantia polymorpha subsp. ruderalis TaxID=1480154 RepID=A0A176VFV2_MARPO|nr:hypothetical protein AXG93_291s1090 [Marchantia polymorpha subsp. ruderalis]